MNRVDSQILHLAVPSIVSNITVPLLGLVDIAITGHMGNAVYIAAIAVGSMIFNVLYWTLGFIRMSTSGLTAQYLGRRCFGGIMRMLVNSLALAMFMALLFIIFRQPLFAVMAWLIHPDSQTIPYVSMYFNICIWGAPAMLGLYAMNGWYIGMQNTRFPMIVAISQNIINILVSLILVFALGMKIEGVAIGTLTAQWAGFLLSALLWLLTYRRLVKYKEPMKVMVKESMAEFHSFFNINRDIFLRTLCLVAVNLFFTSAGARQGNIVLSVNTILLTFFTLFSYFLDGFAYAGEALSGRYYGSKNDIAFNETHRRLFRIGWFTVIAFTIIYLIFGPYIVRLLTNEAEVVSASASYLPWVLLIPVAGVAAFIYDGIFIGITASRGMLQSSFVATVLFFCIYYVLRGRIGNHALWLALIVYLAMRGIIQHYLFKHQFSKI